MTKTENENDIYRFFVTVDCPADMTVGDWDEHLEALGNAVLASVGSELWTHVQRFGPNTGGFSLPAVCYMLPLSMVGCASLAEELVQSYPWFRLRVTFYRTEMFDAADRAADE